MVELRRRGESKLKSEGDFWGLTTADPLGCEDGMLEGQKNEGKKKQIERERQKKREQLGFTPGDCWRLRLLGMLLCALAARDVGTRSANFVAESCRFATRL